MAFTATEGTTAPIILSKEPVPKPPIIRGQVTMFSVSVLAHDRERNRVTFRSRYLGFIVITHDVDVLQWFGDCLTVRIEPETVVTWERDPVQ